MITLLLTFVPAIAQETPAAPATVVVAVDDGYRIGPGDEVKIKVHRVNFEITDFVVSENGEISFPYVGRVKLSGLSTFEAEDHLKKVLKEGYIRDPEVTVQVLQHSGHRVELMGSVKSPGIYSLSRSTTLRGLITQAGGAKEGSTIYVNRGEEQIVIGSSQIDGEAGDLLLDGDDVIMVLEGERIYLAGEVANEGSLPFRRGMTASQALLEGGGFGKFARPNAAYIVRGDEKIKVKLKRIIKGKVADVPLKPGDRLIVPVNPL